MIPHVSRFMNRTSHSLALVVFAMALSVAFAGSLASAQDSPREKPKLKDFGSSVRKLKWDPERKAAGCGVSDISDICGFAILSGFTAASIASS